jgi:PPOX class probable F420-dependent enzyme
MDDAVRFLEDNHRAVLTTFRGDGRVQMSPVSTTVDAAGRAVVSTRQSSAKARNLRRDPRASLCVFTDTFYGPWVRIDGTVEVVALPEAMDGLVDYYRRIRGEHDDWDEYRAAMREEGRVLLRLHVEDAHLQG